MKRTTAVLLVTAALILALVFVVGCPKKSTDEGPGVDQTQPGMAESGEAGTAAGDMGEASDAAPASGKLAELLKDRTPAES